MDGPQRIDASRRWALHDMVASRAIEAQAQAGLPPHALMQRAGTSVARLALAIAPHVRRCLILAGPGNNGGDGLLAAAVLRQTGIDARVHLVGVDRPLPGDARWAKDLAIAAGVPITSGEPIEIQRDDLLVDALLGLGGGRALQGPMRAAAALTHRHGGPVLAVDLPSGLSADTGQAAGLGVRATHTLSLLTLKPGLFMAEGRDASGEIWFDDLNVSLPHPSAWRIDAAAAGAAIAPRRHADHKGSHGDVVVVGGAAGMAGAADLAAQAALTAGAGRVYLSALSPAHPTRPELMQRPDYWQATPAEIAAATLVCGCGGGAAIAATLPALLTHARRAVVDADALNAIAADTTLLHRLTARASRGAMTVLTPHPLEAARLLGSSAAAVQSDRLAAAQELAQRARSVVVLKGSGTVVAAPGCVPFVNGSGNGRLATPGSGDVLAGWIGGAWSSRGDLELGLLLEGVAACCWLHGHAADLAAERSGLRSPLLAGDQIALMSAALPG